LACISTTVSIAGAERYAFVDQMELSHVAVEQSFTLSSREEWHICLTQFLSDTIRYFSNCKKEYIYDWFTSFGSIFSPSFLAVNDRSRADSDSARLK
jgi:hypothetical protein